ncbi:hypothetical protein RIF29_42350 [Crotalaria pallida]|uniref:Uncharacterized protein n=1 Tax=Crotalaria pallida TaxID=3830 RepID=A0AAN9E8Z5_CROPI
MASSSENKQKFFSNGSITELFSFRSGIVILMDYDENQTLRILGIGQFMVYLMMHVFYPIMITVCSINDFHWPLTKDTVIFRMANRTFAFALPGLLYGLQFPPFCEDSMMDALENLFMKFGYYCKVMGDKGLAYASLGPAVEQEKHGMKKKKEEWERVMKEASITSGDTSGSTTSGVAPTGDKGKGIMP